MPSLASHLATLLLFACGFGADAIAHDGEWPPKADPQWDTGSITAFSDAGGGFTDITAVAHRLTVGQLVSISNSPNYNGNYTIVSVTTDSFRIAKTFAPGTTGTWSCVVGNPLSGDRLYLDRIEFSIPSGAPHYYAEWVTHWHNQGSGCSGAYGGRKTDFAFGDVDNDGQADDIVITMAGEAVFAAEMVVNHSTGTGQLNPLWLWRTPWAVNKLGVTPYTTPYHNGNFSCSALNRNNPLIWNLLADGAGDSTNEVAFVGLADDGTANGQERLYVLRTNAGGGVSVVAESRSSQAFQVEHRLGICKVRKTSFARDLAMTEHGEGRVFVWTCASGAITAYSNAPSSSTDVTSAGHGLAVNDQVTITGTVNYDGTYSVTAATTNTFRIQRPFVTNEATGSFGRLAFKYQGDPFTHGGLRGKSHEFNWLDLDGDGFDEFFLNGLLDFVDADASGNPVPTNTTHNDRGIARWQAIDGLILGAGNGAHSDQVICADWDPTRPGLEVLAVTEVGSGNVWVEAQTGVVHPYAFDTLWDADCGQLLNEWTTAPAVDGQVIYAANWAGDLPGVERISSPKDLAQLGQVRPPGQLEATGCYVSNVRVTPDVAGDEEFDLLTIDGAVYNGSSPYDTSNALRVRSGGPWGRVFACDWDGDYASDEVLHHPADQGALALFRLGVKGDWGTGSLPAGLPTQSEVQSNAPPITTEGDDNGCSGAPGWWYFSSQGECGEHVDDWGWSHGGPGRGTHYFQKLKEVHAGEGSGGAIVVKPYDLGGPDHREEVVAISATPTPRMHVYFNSAPLAPGVLPRPSPHESLKYRAHRQSHSVVMLPFQFLVDAVSVERFTIQPANVSLPERVVGIPEQGSVQMKALIEYSDGSVVDVSGSVTWGQDPSSLPYMQVSSGGLVSHGAGSPALSGRFHAELVIDGKLQRSEPSYVFASNSANPTILRAGYVDTWLVDDTALDDRVLKLEAYVGQKDNQNSTVYTLNLNGTRWQSIQLKDDGLNGDGLAGDGIYTARFAGSTGLALGDTLKAIRALLPPITTPAPPSLAIPTGVANSAPWPYLVVDAATAPPWPNPASPPPASSEPASYEAPRISSLGYRGWGVSGEFLLEAQVLPSPLHPAAAINVYAMVPGQPAEPMTNEGGGLYTLRKSTAGVPAGLYVVHVAATVNDDGFHASDAYPKLRLHGYPSFDVDQPAPSLGFCSERIGW